MKFGIPVSLANSMKHCMFQKDCLSSHRVTTINSFQNLSCRIEYMCLLLSRREYRDGYSVLIYQQSQARRWFPPSIWNGPKRFLRYPYPRSWSLTWHASLQQQSWPWCGHWLQGKRVPKGWVHSRILFECWRVERVTYCLCQVLSKGEWVFSPIYFMYD